MLRQPVAWRKMDRLPPKGWAPAASTPMNTPVTLYPVTGAIGAEIGGFDVARVIRSGGLADYAAALKAALHRHHVLFLRDQDIDRDDQKQLTRLFGPLTQVPYVAAMADDPAVIAVLKEAQESGGGVFGGDWHSDFSFLPRPPAGSVLRAVEVPPFGGDTLWANQVLALETLPAELRRQIAGRDGIHSGKPYGVAHAPPPQTQSGRSIKMTRGDPAADREQAHPLIRRHPESGADALFVNPIYTTRLADRDEAASADLLTRLYHHATNQACAVAGGGKRAISRFGTTARPCITRLTIMTVIAVCSIARVLGISRPGF